MLVVWCVLFFCCNAMANDELITAKSQVEFAEGLQSYRSSEDTFLGRIRNFLAGGQVMFKFNEVLPASHDIERSMKGALDFLNGLDSVTDDESARKGGGGLGGKKGGGGAILAMATMMGGTMAALGFGAVGMLAMKALTVSAMALVLSAAIGLKKLLSKDEGEGGHSVSYIPVHHGGGHRRRRDVSPLPYAAYSQPKVKIRENYSKQVYQRIRPFSLL